MLYVSVPLLFLSFPLGLKKGVFEDSYSNYAVCFPTTRFYQNPIHWTFSNTNNGKYGAFPNCSTAISTAMLSAE